MKDFHNNYLRLARENGLLVKEQERIKEVLQFFPFKISDYYLNLIDGKNKTCPVKLQTFPIVDELNFEGNDFDTCHEKDILKYGCLLHRYEDRVLLLVSNQCFTYCRFCTRKWFLGKREHTIKMEKINKALEYIKNNKKIKEVILSGGDPLVLSDNILKGILDKLVEIENVRIIRIGTRAPVMYPKRITPELCNLLGKYDILWIMVHFNHINEITQSSTLACNLLRKSGLPVLNQTVLLNGINDTKESLKKLFEGLVEIGVKPYYLYLCDKIPGTSHFWVSLKHAKTILTNLDQQISGLALPVFIVVDSKSWKKRLIFDKHTDIERILAEAGEI